MSDAERLPEYELKFFRNSDKEFYELMGPLLSRREVVNEIGGPIWDDDDKVWTLALADTGVIGMCATRGQEICSFYVRPSMRGQSVGYALLRATLQAAPNARQATVGPSAVGLFTMAGFTASDKRGRYTKMRLES